MPETTVVTTATQAGGDLAASTYDAVGSAVGQWSHVLLTPLQEVQNRVVGFLPQLLGAILVLIIGSIIARIITHILERVLHVLKVDAALSTIGVTRELKNMGVGMTVGEILAKVVYIFLILVVWLTVVSILNIPQLTDFMNDIINYLPKVFVAIVILAVGIAVAKVVQNVATRVTAPLHISKSDATILGNISKYTVLVFAVLASLLQLGIATSLIETFFTGVVAMFAIGGGLALGLGLKDRVSSWVDDIGGKEKSAPAAPAKKPARRR